MRISVSICFSSRHTHWTPKQIFTLFNYRPIITHFIAVSMANIFFPLTFWTTLKSCFEQRKNENKRIVILFRCDSKIKANMLFADKCRQQFRMTHRFRLRLFVSVCMFMRACLSISLKGKKGQIHLSTILTTAVFDPSSYWNLVINFSVYVLLSHSL